MALSPFDVLNAINVTKEDVFENIPIEANYNSFIINRGLSYFPDTIFYASEMCRYPNIPNKWQFDYYINIVPKKKRFSKWSKKEELGTELQAVCDYYKYTKPRALEALSLLSREQIDFIVHSQNRGGKNSL